jgi:hypothetical protein
MQERYEIQIFDSYNNETPTYSNGQCGSIYKQSIPMSGADNRYQPHGADSIELQEHGSEVSFQNIWIRKL